MTYERIVMARGEKGGNEIILALIALAKGFGTSTTAKSEL
jgi:hypothetical protein